MNLFRLKLASQTSHEGSAQACQNAELPFLSGARMQPGDIHTKAKCCEDALILTTQAAGFDDKLKKRSVIINRTNKYCAEFPREPVAGI